VCKNSVYVVHEEGYGCKILGVFSTLKKAESLKKRFTEIYPNKYSSSSGFWYIRITETRLDSEEKYLEQAEWIWNDIYNIVLEMPPAKGKNNSNILMKAIQDARLTGRNYLKAKITVNCFELNADLPTMQEQMSKGLSVKDKLRENEAMLFVFDVPSRQPFWMKDMKFSVDIAWFDSHGKAVHIEENLEPCSPVFNCPLYSPSTSSQYVLETVAGFTRKHNLNLGTNISVELIG